MRRLLIKLVAVETAIVGWLAYWLFLVYADNPSVAQGLASQLSKFPQLSFTTVDITVLVIIGVLSIFLAFKFQRGLKPGIRLERALQMLENLMKRNLILEAQVAEMKLDRAQVITTPPGVSPTEGRLGSWEKAFRTPIEAGPPPPTSNRSTGFGATDPGIEHEAAAIRPPFPKAELKHASETSPGARPRQDGSERQMEKIMTGPGKTVDKPPMFAPSSPTWEDSPKYMGETSGILTPSPLPRKQNPTSSEPISTKVPYIPTPVPKTLPSSVILGPGVSPIPTARPLPKGPPNLRPSASPQSSQKPGPIFSTPPVTVSSKPPTVSTPSSSATETTRQSSPDKPQANAALTSTGRDDSETHPKAGGKPSPGKKRFPWEDD